MNSKHVRDLKFGMHLPCMAIHKFGVAILKLRQFFGHRLAKKQNCQNRYFTPNLWNATQGRYTMHSKFEVPSMLSGQINVPFVSFQYRDLKVLCVLNLQANHDFQKFTTKARTFFRANFLIFYIPTRSLKITKLVFEPLNIPLPLLWPGN